MTPDHIPNANAELHSRTPLEIIRWAMAQANAGAIVSTNFRPYEAVILHLATRVQPHIPVLWVDHGSIVRRLPACGAVETLLKLPPGLPAEIYHGAL